jgi:hypothetical protein
MQLTPLALPLDLANLCHFLPKDVGHRFSLSGLLLAGMKIELIDLEQETASAGENKRPRPARLALEPVNNPEITPQQRLLRQLLDFTRSHEYSPLNE